MTVVRFLDSGLGVRVLGSGLRGSGFQVQDSEFRVPDFGFGDSGFGSGASVLGFRASIFLVWERTGDVGGGGLELDVERRRLLLQRVQRYLRVPGFSFRVSDFGLLVWGFGLQASE